MKKRNRAAFIAAFMMPFLVWAQAGTISGTVTESTTGDPLPGANVVVEGTTFGAAADAYGDFIIANVPAGSYTITASVIGYAPISETVSLAAGATATLDFALEPTAIALSGLEILASRATRETPVAYTNVDKTAMVTRLGSQDIPMILNTTPSVYATMQGGGAGDARVNVRGFNQRNVAIMINGVPVNDMENGWVYWSNWDGVADATSSIQMQRGLSAVNLAAPSIGGTMNILTDPTSRSRGGLFKQEYGSGTFLKTTIGFHSGLIGDKLAVSGTLVRKTGNGVIDKAWTDAWAYYLGASYALNSRNRFEFYALGAPQRHGQMRYAQNIATYSQDLAEDIFDDSVLNLDEEGAEDAEGNDIPNGVADVFDTFPEASTDRYGDYDDAESGRFYNENWNILDNSYKGKQYYYMYGEKKVDRHDPDYLNESENYYHKPQVNLNWYLTLNDQMRLSTVLYYSGGSGGGTGTFNDIVWNYSGPSRIADWDATIANNIGTTNRKGNDKPAGESIAFLRNSINRQYTFGAISKLNVDMSDALKVQVGLDWRTAEIEHAREVRDLLGGDYAVNGDYDNYAALEDRYEKLYNEFDTSIEDAKAGLGDIINYHNTNTVDWLGLFGQGEYKAAGFSFYGMGGYSMVKYTLVDHFKKATNWDFDYVKATSDGEVSIEADWIGAIQFKGGGLYRLAENLDVFGNFGYVEKVPIFDNIIDDTEIALAPDPTNEKFISTEVGINFSAMARKLAAKVNVYMTNWLDRNLVRAVTSGQGTSGDTDLIFLTGLDQSHQGLEVELAFQPINLLRLDAAVSFGNWVYMDDAEGTYKDIAAGTTEQYTYAVKDLRVGDMPQTIFSFTASVFPIQGLTLMGTMNYYDRFWANWDPSSREIGDDGEADRDENWQVPAYSKIDLHAYYDLPFDLGGIRMQAFFHLFNALDAIYVQDALDNSQYNAFGDDGKNHEADDAEVYLGHPRYFNMGLSVRF
jgi:hypothetical protein